MRSRRKYQESGFALLFVLAMAAIIAIMLYLELPRVAFEAQRSKEALLIDRGQQYQRAIKLFFHQFQRYPASLYELENTNNMRFLRRRYKDPMTGKDDWRIIHVANGVFVDSLTIKPPKPAGSTEAVDLTANMSGDGSQPQQAPSRWQIQRPSQIPSAVPSGAQGTDAEESENADSQAGGESGEGYPQQQAPLAFPGQQGPYDQTAAAQALAAQQQAANASPGAAQPAVLLPGQPGYGPGVVAPGQPGFQGGAAGMPGEAGSQPGQRPYRPGVPAYGSAGQQPVYPPVLLPGMRSPSLIGAGSSNPALSAVDNQLRGGSSPDQSSPTAFTSAALFGSGIAGVASKSKAESIKVYKDHTEYDEWEFIYDPRQEIVLPGGAQPASGTTPGGTTPGTPN
jgi:type II secretory pathway pseudopilin PulG